MHYPRTEHSVRLPQRIRTIVCVAGLIAVLAPPSAAQERLCDNSFEDCRASILSLIRAERVGIDVSFWFMTDWRYSSESSRAGGPASRCEFCSIYDPTPPTRRRRVSARTSSTRVFRSVTKPRQGSITGR